MHPLFGVVIIELLDAEALYVSFYPSVTSDTWQIAVKKSALLSHGDEPWCIGLKVGASYTVANMKRSSRYTTVEKTVVKKRRWSGRTNSMVES